MSRSRRRKPSLWEKVKRFLRKQASTNTTPHEIALGFSIGVFIGVFPTPGVSLLLALLVIWLFRVNRVAVLLGLPIANPLTSPLFFVAGVRLGSWILGTDVRFSRLEFSFGTLFSVLREYLLGVFILSAFLSALGYAVVYYLVKRHRERKGTG